MLLSAEELEKLTGALWVSSTIMREAFGHDSTTAMFFLRVVHALERGEAVQRKGGWVREGDGVYKKP